MLSFALKMQHKIIFNNKSVIFKEFIDQLREEFECVESEDDLMAFLLRTQLTLVKSQMIAEIKKGERSEKEKMKLTKNQIRFGIPLIVLLIIYLIILLVRG